MDDHNTNMDAHGAVETDIETIDTNHANTVDNSVGTPENPKFSAPLLRDPVTGKFVKGTGTRGHLGGRPKGAKDKLSVQFLDVMQAVIEEKGTEMMMRLAEENPAAALAIISRSLPQKAMQEAIDGIQGESNEITQVNINLVSSPSPRLSDHRSQAEIDDRQRGLESPVKRLSEPSEDDLRHVIAEGVNEPTRASQDDLAAREAREKRERLNASIRAHGGATGRARRAQGPVDPIEYRDNEDWL